MSRLHGVEIAGEVEVDLVGGLDSGFTAAGAAAFVSKDWAERGLPDRECDVFADLGEALGQSDGGGGFAFAGRCGGDCRDDDELAGCWALRKRLKRDLRLIVAVGFDICR